MNLSDKTKLRVLLVVSALVLLVLALQKPIPQPLEYHDFADNHHFLGIPNFCNVISNLPFAFVSLAAFFWRKDLHISANLKWPYVVFFSGVFFVAFGSSYYHWEPNNATLLWDRLPMTLAFMAFFTIVIAEYIDEKRALQLFYPFLLVGLISVLYWYYSETKGAGDLRLYVAVQFLPIILTSMIFVFYQSPYTHHRFMWLIFVAYGLAKVFEHFDREVYTILGDLGGHPIKHIAAAFGPLIFLFILKKRQTLLVDNNLSNKN